MNDLVVLYCDLISRDNKKCIEVRKAIKIENGYVAQPRHTIYSCLYQSLTERKLAFSRAIRMCKENNLEIVEFVEPTEAEPQPRAVWQ